MVQDMIERIRQAERQGDDIQKEANARAGACLADVNETVAQMRRKAADAQNDLRSQNDAQMDEVCRRIQAEADEKADVLCRDIAQDAEKNRKRAVLAAVKALTD